MKIGETSREKENSISDNPQPEKLLKDVLDSDEPLQEPSEEELEIAAESLHEKTGMDKDSLKQMHREFMAALEEGRKKLKNREKG